MNIFQVDPGPTGTYRNEKVVMSGTRLPEICIVAIKEPFFSLCRVYLSPWLQFGGNPNVWSPHSRKSNSVMISASSTFFFFSFIIVVPRQAKRCRLFTSIALVLFFFYLLKMFPGGAK